VTTVVPASKSTRSAATAATPGQAAGLPATVVHTVTRGS
jgi:hypothetical protein